MWRYQSVHKRGESEYLNQAMERIFRNRTLRTRADETLSSAAQTEPLIADLLRTPQSPPYHIEGPTLRDHLRRILVAHYAVCEEQLHLIDIEEFRRMAGFEGEFDEIEETLKENAALFEVFALVHDIGKWLTCSFESTPHTRGRELGFHMTPLERMDPKMSTTRAELREAYIELYEAFAREQADRSASWIQQEFFATYQIRVRYPWHERSIHTPINRALLDRLSERYRLSARDRDLLEDLVAFHMYPLTDFRGGADPTRIQRYVSFAHKHGYDADDFIDLLQAVVFLDKVCGSQKAPDHSHESKILVNFLRAEHGWSPDRFQKRAGVRAQRKKEETNLLFRQVGLDGVGLLTLLNMAPGPSFGKTLVLVQESVLLRAPLPEFGSVINAELAKRADAFYELTGV